MTRIWLVNWHFQSRITLWCRHKSTNVSMGLCWQLPKFIVWRLWSISSMIYFDHHLPLKPSIGKRRKQSCTANMLSKPNILDSDLKVYSLNRVRQLFWEAFYISFSPSWQDIDKTLQLYFIDRKFGLNMSLN